MEKRKLKDVLSISFILLLIFGLVSITLVVTKSIFQSFSVDNNTYVLRDIADNNDGALLVNTEVEDIIETPFNDDTVNVNIPYYDSSLTDEEKEGALILFNNTYMPNTGILYSSNTTFDVLAIYEGKVENIEENPMFGTIVTINHNNNLISKYSSIKDVTVKVGDTVNVGEIIGTSGENKVVSNSENMLLFEIVYNGEYVNPNNYVNKKISELR